MKKSIKLVWGVLLIAALFSCSSSSSSSNGSAVTVTLAPTNGATNTAVSASITATFSSAITEPASWAAQMTLKKNNTGDTLCTNVSYANLIATCAHADLELQTSYTVTVTGLTDSEGKSIADATATFTTTNSSVTVTLAPVNDAANTAVSASVTATFSAAITEPASWAAQMTLKKNNTGDTLCTSVAYASLVATCAHADLESQTSYTLIVTGLTDSNGTSIADATATFTTVGYTPVGGTVTLRGTLASVTASISAKGLAKATDVTDYKVLILNTGTGEQKTATVAADGTFSTTAVGGSGYIINFLNSENKYIGTLETGTIASNEVAVGVVTDADGTTTNFGTITANTSTGKISSDQTLATDSNQIAYASGGVIAGGTTGEGSENYAVTVGLSCTLKEAGCADYDYDGVPDIFDTDNDNNTYADEIDDQIDLCVPGDVKLHIENYPTCTPGTCAQMNFPTQNEVDADIGGNTMYQLHVEFTPGTGYSISDVSEISVTTPSYIDSYGYVYSPYNNAPTCFNVLWNTCNGKKLILSNDGTKYEVALADTDLDRAGILANMFPGDSFVFSIALTNGTTYTCTKKIGIIPKYYGYDFKYNGATVDTNTTPTWATPISISWTIPSRAPSGMNYAVYLAPYTTCSNFSAASYTSVFSAKDATSATINVESLPASAVNKWSLQLYATDEIGDQSYSGPANFKTAASACGD